MSETSRLEVFINHLPGETRLAVTKDGTLEDFLVMRDRDASVLGNIYLGRVEKVIAGLNAAFIDIGLASSGFLAANDGQIFDPNREKPQPIKALFKEGDPVVVQVTREASEGKGAKLTTRLYLTGSGVVATLGRPGISVSKSITDENEKARLRGVLAGHTDSPIGLILRTKAAALSDGVLQAEAAKLLAAMEDLDASKTTQSPPACLYRETDPLTKFLRDGEGSDWQSIMLDNRALLKQFGDTLPTLASLLEFASDPAALFETYDLEQQIDDLLQAEIRLPSGGKIIIEETAALVAIDVDSGGSGRQADPEAFARAANEAAALEIARQIKLRNLAGQIVIDFVPMKRKENREEVKNLLSGALADAGKCTIFGFSRLGLLEMTRQRNGESLSAHLLVKPGATLSTHSAAFKVLREVWRELDRNPGKMFVVTCSQNIWAVFQGDLKSHWQEFLEWTGPVVVLEENPSLSGTQYSIRAK